MYKEISLIIIRDIYIYERNLCIERYLIIRDINIIVGEINIMIGEIIITHIYTCIERYLS